MNILLVKKNQENLYASLVEDLERLESDLSAEFAAGRYNVCYELQTTINGVRSQMVNISLFQVGICAFPGDVVALCLTFLSVVNILCASAVNKTFLKCSKNALLNTKSLGVIRAARSALVLNAVAENCPRLTRARFACYADIQSVKSVLSSCPKLRRISIYIHSHELFRDIGKHLPRLRSISINCLRIKSSDLVTLADHCRSLRRVKVFPTIKVNANIGIKLVLRKCRNLHELVLSKFRRVGVVFAGSHRYPKLKRFYGDKCDFDATACEYLAQAAPNLKYLHVQNNRLVDDDAIKKLVCLNLKKLQLYATSISEATVNFIASDVDVFPKLKKLSVPRSVLPIAKRIVTYSPNCYAVVTGRS